MSQKRLPENKEDVVIGTTICRRAAFVLDKFLRNQEEIQKAYPGCKLVLFTDEEDFAEDLKQEIRHYDIKAEVITYQVIRPDYARSQIWSITGGREASRQYALSQGVDFFLCLDADMIYEPSIVDILKRHIQGFDVVQSGYDMHGPLGFSVGCMMMRRDTLDKFIFRCYEFKGGKLIQEDEVLDMDFFRCCARVKKGFFLSIKHYRDREKYQVTEPQAVGWFRTITSNLLVRYVLFKISIWVRYNIPGNLHALLYRKILRRG